MAAHLAAAAQDWLAEKHVTSSASNPTESDRARRTDLARWGRAIAEQLGQPTRTGGWDLEADLGELTFDDLSADLIVAALAQMRQRYSAATCRRATSTLRTLCAWAHRRGLTATNPCDDERITIPRRPGEDHTGVLAYPADVVEKIIAAAGQAPTPRERAWWPARDVAMLRCLADLGLRSAELCGLRRGDHHPDGDPATLDIIWGAKGSRSRTVPLPARTTDAIATWLRDHDSTHGDPGATAPLFVRNDGRPFTPQLIDVALRRAARRAGVQLRPQMASHAFGRHHIGTELAKRSVPLPVISQVLGHADPRTTAIYTRAAATEVAGVLDDAGWM